MTREEAQRELDAITAASGNLGTRIIGDSQYQAAFRKTDGSVYSLAELDGVGPTSPLIYTQKSLIITMTRSGLRDAMAEAARKGTSIFINGIPVAAGADPLAGVSSLADLNNINVGPDPAYVAKLQAIANPTAAVPPIVQAPPVIAQTTIIPPVVNQPRPEPDKIVPTVASPHAIPPAMPAVIQQNASPALQQPTVPDQRRPAVVLPPAAALAPARPASQLSLGKITPQTTVLDLIVNGVQTSNDAEAAGLRAVATEKLTKELSAKQPELASNPQALAAAVQQGLPNSIRGLILDLSKDKNVQQKIASGFLDAMRRENPSAEQSGFYQNLKRLSSNEQTFGAFLNTNMLEGITKDFEQRARAENGGRVPATVMDAVANNIMRVKPEIKQYNDRLGQSINDFVCNPEISRQRLLQSASTQREIREGVAKFRREHPFQTFFADMIGTNMHAEGEKRALAEMTKRGMRDKNYSREIQSGFINEFNRRAETEMRGEQLENMRAFTRHLSHLPYSRFIQEDISPRRMSAIILGIERPGEERAPTRHIIPQQLITRNQSPHVNVVAAQPSPDPTALRQQQPPRLTIHNVG